MTKLINVIAALLFFTLIAVDASAQTDPQIKVVVVPLGGDDISGHNFTGPQIDLPVKVAEAAGFSVCHTSTFDEINPIADVLNKCSKPEIMLACRLTGDKVLVVAAHAPRVDAIFDTTDDMTTTHEANGAEWYFNLELSWGFAPLGADVKKEECDSGSIADVHIQARLCHHLFDSDLQRGYMCGYEGRGLNDDPAYELVILHR